MKELFKEINKHVNTKELTAIELFGRTGEWHTIQYMDQVKSLDILELKHEYLEQLKRNCTNANIKICDTIYHLKFGKVKKYDIIVIDAPNSMFGHDDIFTDIYCEHFQVLPLIHRLIDKKAIVIFNIIRDSHPDIQFLHKKAREMYYHYTDDYPKFYAELFDKLGYNIEWSITRKRNTYVYYYCMCIVKK